MKKELLKLENLTVTFGGLTAVDAVNFSVYENEIVSLIGPNGAGKTTTFNAIIGFVKRSSGNVIFDGHNLKDSRPHVVAQKGLTKTFQQTCLFPSLTVLENLRTGCHLNEKSNLWDSIFYTKRHRESEKNTNHRSHEILEFIDLIDKKDVVANSLPYGKQRILKIGIALASGPKMLLLDEPSAGLNNTETVEMMELIKRTRDIGKTILLVEHDMKLVMGISDRIVVLTFGKKLTEGTPEEIKNNPEVIKAYLGAQRDDA